MSSSYAAMRRWPVRRSRASAASWRTGWSASTCPGKMASKCARSPATVCSDRCVGRSSKSAVCISGGRERQKAARIRTTSLYSVCSRQSTMSEHTAMPPTAAHSTSLPEATLARLSCSTPRHTHDATCIDDEADPMVPLRLPRLPTSPCPPTSKNPKPIMPSSTAPISQCCSHSSDCGCIL